MIRQHDGQIKLVDFDNARSGSPARIHDSTLVGTFGYIPLEQLGGTVDQTSDLYALGTTLIHLLSRKAPSELLQPDMSLRFEDAVNAPKLAPWIARLVARNPLERFASALEARAALDQLESSTASLIPSAAAPPAHQLPAQTDTLKSERLSAAPHLSGPIARAHIELYLESYQSWLFIAATSCFLFVVFLFTLLTYDGLSKKSGSWANLLWFIWFGGLSIIPLILRRVFLKWSLDREGVGDGELAWLDWAKARLDADFEEQVIQFDKSNVKAAVEYVVELQKETLQEHRPSE